VRIRAQDLEAMWRTVWGEARGEPHLGKVTVAHVILNRAALQGWMGRTPYAVCHKRRQFSCWNADDPNSAKAAGVGIGKPSALNALFAVTRVLSGRVADPTDGATHYYAFRAIARPRWAATMRETCRIGGHAFLKRT